MEAICLLAIRWRCFIWYKTDGVISDGRRRNDWYDQTEIAKGSQAGDIRYVDITGDGKVTPG